MIIHFHYQAYYYHYKLFDTTVLILGQAYILHVLLFCSSPGLLLSCSHIIQSLFDVAYRFH